MTVFLLDPAPAYEVLTVVSGVLFMVRVGSEFFSSMGPRDDGQNTERAATVYCKEWAARPEEKCIQADPLWFVNFI